LLADGGVWASNTSAIPITELAKVSNNPERFIGLHYFSPVEAMPLLEIVMGEKTNEDTLARCLAFTKKTRKTPIVVNDGYGFFTSRVFATYILEGAALVEEGYDPATIEWAARNAGMAVAPLQVFDEVTLSLIVHAEAQREIYVGKNNHNGLSLVEKMVKEEDRKGRAAGAGFYEYNDEGKRRGLWKGLSALASKMQEITEVEEMQKRLLLVQCAEVGRALDDGIIRQHKDVEVGSIFGIGFAPNTGGPLGFMDRMGLRTVVEELQRFQKSHGERYAPSKTLLAMAEKGERFFEEGATEAKNR
jgi:3-hydroxyacyl-CoA dehydrogenase/enoyl-CoA hydratase/3-hydroxybutyryl-CoA epimerase